MTARVTQQVLVVGYATSPDIRITAIALEVLRPNSSLAVSGAKTQTIVVAS